MASAVMRPQQRPTRPMLGKIHFRIDVSTSSTNERQDVCGGIICDVEFRLCCRVQGEDCAHVAKTKESGYGNLWD